MNFDQKAKDWDKDQVRIERSEIFAHEIIQYIDSRKLQNALEFGSGTGLASFYLKDAFKSITLADTSEGMLEVLKEKIRNEKISNMTPVLIEESRGLSGLGSFDIIYTLLVLHHVKDLDKTFTDFYSSLNPGGIIFIGDLITEDGSFHYSDPEFDGHYGFDPGELSKQIASKGFEMDTEKIFYTIEREHNSVRKQYPLFFIAGKK
jgi:2-polyprenyl-3-methyl-5-hydroxy-6-metoxy-1,4-benzoquinol methylase